MALSQREDNTNSGIWACAVLWVLAVAGERAAVSKYLRCVDFITMMLTVGRRSQHTTGTGGRGSPDLASGSHKTY